MLVFILNAGSSSLKYQLMNPISKEVLATGLCERIGIDGVLKHEFNGNKLTLEVSMPTHKEAIELVLKTLVEGEGKVINSVDDIDAIGHRAVHGGEEFASSVMVTDKVIQKMKELIHTIVDVIRKNATVDWSKRDDVRAQLRLTVKKILMRYGYPPDLAKMEADRVIAQSESLADIFSKE